MSLQPALGPYLERYHALQAAQIDGNKLIEDLIVYANDIEGNLRTEINTLSQRLQDAELDLDDARRSRRELQHQLNAANQRLSQFNMDNEILKNRNPYVVVLIDGDGTLFLDEYIKQGTEGGKRAANALRTAVLVQCEELDDHVEVIAKVCANLSGLTKALIRDGSLDSYDEFHDFTLGFTQGKASFDFIDVGHGKERADSKIKEIARWNLRNHNCKKVLLGISHDAGYAPFLDEILHNEHVTRRVAIIEGSQIVRELSNTGADIMHFDHIFRNEKLIERKSSHTSIKQEGQTLPVRTATNGKKANGSVSSMPPAPTTWAGAASTPLITPPPMVFPVAVKNAAAAAEKAAEKAAGAATIISPHPKMKWNPGGRGLDEQLIISAPVLKKIKERTGNNKLCNNHYLRGPCAKMDDCPFEHKYKATEEDIKAISFLTRLNPCVNGQECEIECIYGHHCPSWGLDLSKAGGQRGEEGVCGAFGCRFGKEGHPPATVIKHPKKWVDYGSY